MKAKPKDKPQAAAAATPAETKPYEATKHEKAAAQRLLDHRARNAPAPRYKVKVANGRTTIEPDHPEPAAAYSLLSNTLSTGDAHFAEGLLYQLADVAHTGKDLTARELNAMVATVHAIGPRDPTEALLAAQMAAIHQATMIAARRLNRVEMIDQQDSCSGMLSKLARTFATQVEALKRYRSSGEQSVKVTHQHVNVTAKRAVVGINQGGGGDHENPNQSHAPRKTPSDKRGPTLLSHEQAQPLPMQITGREGPECLPDAWRDGGSAKGKS